MSLAEILAEQDAPPPIAAKERAQAEEVTTPAGLEIKYEDRRHMYYLREGSPIEPTDWRKVPSVSAIIGIIDKSGPLTWWGQGVTIGAIVHLLHTDATFGATLDKAPDVAEWLACGGKSANTPAGIRDIVAHLTANKVTVNHVKETAAARGSTVHDALEAWAVAGTVPDPAAYADEQRGYVAGLVAFLGDAKLAATSTERIVGSLEHGFAGRYDLEAALDGCELVTRLDEKKGVECRTAVPGGTLRLDLKTSGAVYPEMFLQLEGYEGASVECGYDPTDMRAVLRVTADGRYEFRVSPSSFDAFLAVKRCFDAVAELKAQAKL